MAKQQKNPRAGISTVKPQPLRRCVPFILAPLLTCCGGDEPNAPNQPPIVNAGTDQTVEAGTTVVLPGAAADPDGTIVSHAWTQTGGTAVMLAGAGTATAAFTAPFVAADEALTFRLSVTDDDGETNSDDVRVVVRASGYDFVRLISISAGGAVSTEGDHACGLREEGEAACWGSNYLGQSMPPAGIFTSVSAGGDHPCGLRETGRVTCWGSNYSDQSTPPPPAGLPRSAPGANTPAGFARRGNWHAGAVIPPASPRRPWASLPR
ncbi:MAG: hypothetical protein OXP66_10550 [Candidatus Tectomicrobia bacterium]|nr:hypothetical protein [Candidatus Tectomicrobia bacterium]